MSEVRFCSSTTIHPRSVCMSGGRKSSTGTSPMETITMPASIDEPSVNTSFLFLWSYFSVNLGQSTLAPLLCAICISTPKAAGFCTSTAVTDFAPQLYA